MEPSHGRGSERLQKHTKTESRQPGCSNTANQPILCESYSCWRLVSSSQWERCQNNASLIHQCFSENNSRSTTDSCYSVHWPWKCNRISIHLIERRSPFIISQLTGQALQWAETIWAQAGSVNQSLPNFLSLPGTFHQRVIHQSVSSISSPSRFHVH